VKFTLASSVALAFAGARWTERGEPLTRAAQVPRVVRARELALVAQMQLEPALEAIPRAVLEAAAEFVARAGVARLAPERCRLTYHDEGLHGRSLESWERSLTWGSASERWAQRAPARPHARSIERVAADWGPLTWFDLELVFDGPDGAERMRARYVWDVVTREWFLHATAVAVEESVEAPEAQDET
jgi:hypothetical protein